MSRIYLLTLLALLLTEYGFQSRQSAMTRFLGPWPARRTLIRVGLWLGSWILAGSSTRSIDLIALAGAALLTELAVWILRARLRRDVAAGRNHGRIRTHLLPLLLGALPLLPLLAMDFAGALRLSIGHLSSQWDLLRAAVGFVALWNWATLMTVSVIDRVRPDALPKDEEGAIGAGEVIGVLERLLAFVLILHQAPTAVAIGIAAKSAVRFPEFEDKEFAEYFLVGTLTSIGLGIGAALLAFS